MDVTGRTVTTAEAAVREGAMVQTPTPPTKTYIKLGLADRMDAKEVGWHRGDNGLGEMGKHPWGQPSAPTGEGGASQTAPTDKEETSVGPAIDAQRRRWGHPSATTGEGETYVRLAIESHRRRWDHPLAPTGN